MAELRTREQQAVETTWDLTLMFANDEAFEALYQEADNEIKELGGLKGTLSQSPEQLAKAITEILEVERKVHKIAVYAHLKNDQDQGNATYQTMNDRATQLAVRFGEAVAFFDPELLTIDEKTLTQWVETTPALKEYTQYLNNMNRQRPHILSEESERLLAQGQSVLNASSKTFSLLNNADIEFPQITLTDGTKVQLTHGNYGTFLESEDRHVRQQAFEGMYSAYNQFKNTFASTLSTTIQKNNYLAKVRHYQSAREAALFRNNIPESVYDTLVETINDKLPLLHRYLKLRKTLLGLDDMQMYDMYTPLLGEVPVAFTYETAKETVLEALAPLGEEYQQVLREAFDERWIDWFENKGKRSGAYSSGMYDSKPYILMNWQDRLASLYTLVHELGHSVHSYFTRKYQPYVYGNYPIFLAEIASTTNENLLTDYLLKKYTDIPTRLYIINNFIERVKSTMYRQTQFAEFEHFMYTSDAAGIPLTQEFLSTHYQELNARYYGEDVNSDSEIKLEWSRIPHFYYNYYVFQYSTGFAAATAFSSRILSGDASALDLYLGFLKSGSSYYAIDTMKNAGLDMTKSDYLVEALQVFERYMDEFEDLLEQLD